MENLRELDEMIADLTKEIEQTEETLELKKQVKEIIEKEREQMNSYQEYL